MSRYFWSIMALVSLAATFLNTDFIIPVLRGFTRGDSVWLTVVGVSILANTKVILAFVSARKSGATQKMSRFAWFRWLLGWAEKWLRRCEIIAIPVLTVIPLPGLRAVCTFYCGATQSPQGLMALLVANPIHVWSFVAGSDWIFGEIFGW